jgi:hypothetical protein
VNAEIAKARTVTIIDLHDRIMGRSFNAAKDKHHHQFQAAGMIGQALQEARESATDALRRSRASCHVVAGIQSQRR